MNKGITDINSTLLNILGAIACALVFYADVTSPLGVAWGFVYTIVVLMTLWIKGMNPTVVFSLIGVMLTFFGLFFKPEGTDMYIVLTNRVLSIISILITMFGIIQYKRRENIIQQQQRDVLKLTEELKVSNADLEQFAYVASHDLQEPLRKIQSFGDRILITEKSNLSEKGQDYFDRMMNASSRMQTLINDLLTYSRLSTGNNPFVKIDLNEVLHEVLDDLELVIEKSGAKIETEKLPHIAADRTQIKQLFQNLISNSIKFRKENEAPLIKLQCREIQDSASLKNKIEITVTDNGIGFDSKYAEKVFQFFQRLEGKKYEGSGIGLAVCRKIAVRHGGNIAVQSEAGTGTTFIINLPVGG
ncbi:MAG: hypothetical protein IPM74_11130 [Crocinitomicaceae bacterium]|nr:hypothetical protein [Crocinitomicaceae bacterium]MBK8926435.1 hypothetical protein [Crocinitomicaceae bacterium]